MTFGPRAFNAVNAVASAYDDAQGPMLVMSRALERAGYQEHGKLLEPGSRQRFECGGILAVEETLWMIDWLPQVALDQERPVYVQILLEMQKAEISVPGCQSGQPASSDEQTLLRVAEQLAHALNTAAILLGEFVDQERLQQMTEEILS